MGHDRVVFRVDIDELVGTGHFIRCYNIAESLRRKGISSYFIMKKSKGAVEKSREVGIETYFINQKMKASEEAHAILTFMDENKINLIITDVKNLQPETLNALKRKGYAIIKFDIPCEISVFDERGIRKQYHSPKYVVLNDPHNRIVSYHKKQKIAGEVKRIMAFMGGFDRSATTIKLIEIFTTIDLQIEKTILVSTSFMHFDMLSRLKEEMAKHNIRILVNPHNIWKIIYASDIVFSSGGNMMYEFACIGVPIVCLYEDQQEKELSKRFEELNIAVNLGKGTQVG
jgi:UDP-2,4-diacetamido-2,4,6-trideoxy-beta-L-altropyranose hydrolase